ncbi:MAG: type II toxin-antitoxin system RelE/ParE family toxin [Alcanivoracaceae bacterium]|nr:type II toxin-antitoxin system RelE/ParE family toxin [Alcanivoracaceae bacterium]
MRLEISESATEDFNRLKKFISIKSPIAANRMAKKLAKGIRRLLLYPEIGKEVKNATNPKITRDVFILDYHIRYSYTKNILVVLTIWHQKEDR